MNSDFLNFGIPLTLKFKSDLGIYQDEYDLYRKNKKLSIQNLKYISQDEIIDLYYSKYWIKGKCHLLKYPLNLVHFDSCSTMGVKSSIKILQEILNFKPTGELNNNKDFKNIPENKIYDICIEYCEKRYDTVNKIYFDLKDILKIIEYKNKKLLTLINNKNISIFSVLIDILKKIFKKHD